MVSLQNCINEPVVASVVGEDRTLGSIASLDHRRADRPRRGAPRRGKSGDSHTVFRVGQPNGKITNARRTNPRPRRAVGQRQGVTDNLMGERWTKLVINGMGNGMSASTGMKSRDLIASETHRHFMAKLGSEIVRIGQPRAAAGRDLPSRPDVIALAGTGDHNALRVYDENRLA